MDLAGQHNGPANFPSRMKILAINVGNDAGAAVDFGPVMS